MRPKHGARVRKRSKSRKSWKVGQSDRKHGFQGESGNYVAGHGKRQNRQDRVGSGKWVEKGQKKGPKRGSRRGQNEVKMRSKYRKKREFSGLRQESRDPAGKWSEVLRLALFCRSGAAAGKSGTFLRAPESGVPARAPEPRGTFGGDRKNPDSRP